MTAAIERTRLSEVAHRVFVRYPEVPVDENDQISVAVSVMVAAVLVVGVLLGVGLL
jgi:hypothetical protein